MIITSDSISHTTRTFTPPQAEVLDSHLLDTGFSCVLQMPTGSGKTWLAELAIESTLQAGYRAIYLTPLRALATELTGHWQSRFAPFKVGIFTGDYGIAGRPYPIPFDDAHLLVMTPERLDACSRFWQRHWHWLPDVDLVVVDELHLLGDPHRGSRLEGALLRIRRLNPFARVLGLSATLGNRTELADWLDGIEYVSTWRPIPLTWRVVRYRKAADKPNLTLTEVQHNIDTGGKSLVFVQSRRRAEELSRYLQSYGLRAQHHHAGLPHDERRTVEDSFRNHNSDVLIATATLEMGLNLPVRQVLLYDLQGFDGTGFAALPTNNVWQRVGRAGRPGLDPAGEAVLLAPSWDHQADRYPAGHFEPIRSGLSDTRALAEQVVAEVASGLAKTPTQLKTVFAQSLAARQGILADIDTVITQMQDAGMLAERQSEDEPLGFTQFKVTRLGRIAVRHFLAPATVLRFHRTLGTLQDLTFFDLLLLATCSDDCEPVLPVDYEELDALAADLPHEPTHLLQHPRKALAQILDTDGQRLLAALKMALVMRAWTRTGDAKAVAEQFDCYPFEVERLRQSLDRLLLALAAIPDKLTDEEQERLELLDHDLVPLPEYIQTLHRMVTAGLDEEAVTLTLIQGLGPTLAKRLQAAGVTDIEALALADPTELAKVQGLSQKRAERWITEAVDLLPTRSAYRYRETGPTIAITPPGWPSEVDPYRLRRALDLDVKGVDGGMHLVTGGLEPHIVQLTPEGLQCDCVDAGKGHQCKHRLAVRLYRGDRALRKLAKQLGQTLDDGNLNLFDLWYAGKRL